jgi:hypothetical protein
MVFYYQMIYSPETINTVKHNPCYGYWCGTQCTMYNDTYSVHKRSLVLWRARLLCSEAFYNVYLPPLSDANCLLFPPLGRPVPLSPPTSEAATISPSILSVTVLMI